jgi:hypothetical protein
LDLQVDVSPLHILSVRAQEQQEAAQNCSKEFRELINQIEQKHFFGKQTDLQCNVNFVMKRANKMVNNFGHKYLVNHTMLEELNFISVALKPDSGIVFETHRLHT